MEGLEFTILSHGFIENDYAWNIAVPNPARLSNKHPETKWVRVPTYSVLVKHPKIGYFMYDTGPCVGDEAGRRPVSMSDFFPLFAKREEFLDQRLASLNLTPDDINLIVISHMHWDHGGGLKFFEHAKNVKKVIAGRKDYEFGLVQTHSPNKVPDECPYFRENFEFSNLDFELIEEDVALAEGVKLIMLEGHTPSIVGMLLSLESGNVIFPSDAVYCTENYGPPAKAPGIIYDTLGFQRSVRKLRALQEAYDAKIIFPHDFEQFKELKIAPYFYK